MLVKRRMMAEAVAAEVFKGFEENGGERLLVLLVDGADFLGRLQGLIALRMAHLGKHETGGEGGTETNLYGQGARSLGVTRQWKSQNRKNPSRRGGFQPPSPRSGGFQPPRNLFA